MYTAVSPLLHANNVKVKGYAIYNTCKEKPNVQLVAKLPRTCASNVTRQTSFDS